MALHQNDSETVESIKEAKAICTHSIQEAKTLCSTAIRKAETQGKCSSQCQVGIVVENIVLYNLIIYYH